jgi:hypothetical protein
MKDTSVQIIESVNGIAKNNKFKAVVYENHQAVDLGFPKHLMDKIKGFTLKLGLGNKNILSASVRGGNVRISMPKQKNVSATKLESEKREFWLLVQTNLQELIA